MSNDDPEKTTAPPATVSPGTTTTRFRFSEDWAATVTGLVLLAVSLIGLLPAGLVP